MSEETPHHDSGATPASNQNLILGLVLGAAVLLLGFLVVQNQGGDENSSANSEVSELKRELEAERSRLQALRNQNGLGPIGNNLGGVNPEALANEISSEANQLAGLVSQISSVIAQKDQALQTAEGTRQALSKRIQDLERQLADLSASATESLSLRQKLESTERLLTASNQTIQDLRARLNEAPDAAQMERLRAENERLRQELASLSTLETELSRLREENRALRAKLDRSLLFVESADALPEVAQRLYRELNTLEGLDPESLASQYARIGSQLNARVLRKINFATGSASLTNDKIAMIENDIETAPPNAFLLVVGYASTTGNTDSNRKLSSDRATTVASQINMRKKAGQNVRAVFLSETTRFSTTEPPRNQICEVWEILP
ncbi:MAG: OmpA family protein [Verrucomicrobiota bacterium JB023]|nr:OmpA family protein [Verrucomicrobiota bacterium JB023]